MMKVNELMIGFAYLALGPSLSRAETIDLPPILKEGSPTELLSEDPVLPVRKVSVPESTGSGTLTRGLIHGLSLPLAEAGTPGYPAQVRGLGLSPEDTDVQAFGLSLNPAQGQGFDFASFPSFLWADSQFQLGPSGADPKGVAGTLRLTPWTEQALRLNRRQGGATQSASTLGQYQSSVAASLPEIAAVAGYSYGIAKGPSGGFSGKWGREGSPKGKVHLLATDLEGPTFGYTKLASQRLIRALPVFEIDFNPRGGDLLRSAVFYDVGLLRYEDTPAKIYSFSRTQQGGVASTYLIDAWRFGFNARGVRFEETGFSPPFQNSGNAQISRVFTPENWVIEPTLRGVWASDLGVGPEGSLGFRREFHSGEEAVFTRLSYSRRIPSIVDRYLVIPRFYRGNPNLKPERTWTATVGAQWKGKSAETTLQLHSQLRDGVQTQMRLPTGEGTSINSGRGTLLAVLSDTQVHPWDFVDFSNSLSLTTSRVSSTGHAFSYLPPFTEIIGTDFHPTSRNWNLRPTARFASFAISNSRTGEKIKGYSVIDLEFGWRVWQPSPDAGVRASVSIENLLNRPFEWLEDFPTPGRVLGVSVSANF